MPDWPAPILNLDVLDSTNAHLRRLAAEHTPLWTVVLAARQERGRGRVGRTWQSPLGNLHLSVLLPPPSTERLTLVPLLLAVAVQQALADLGVAARLKWPNDLLVGDRKVAGILVETAFGGVPPGALVAGIGINVATVPPGVALATSLRREGYAGEPAAVAAAVLPRCRGWYDRLEPQPVAVLDAWRAGAVAWWGRRVQVRSGATVACGVVRDVDEDGALLLEADSGALTRIYSGDVQRVRLAPPD